MSDIQIINKFGTMQGWNSIDWNFLGRDVEGVTRIQYDDTVPLENVYGKGKMPIGRAQKNYAATFGFTIKKEELDALHSSLPPGTRLQDLAPSDSAIQYERNDGSLGKDRVYNIQIIGRGIEVEQEDGTIDVDVECICSHVDWNIL